MKKGDWVYFWWSASEAHKVKFVKWVRARMGNGREDTNKIGVGALVWSDWLFRYPLLNRRQRGGLRAGYLVLRPYTDLWRKDPYRWFYKAVRVRRPKVKDVR